MKTSTLFGATLFTAFAASASAQSSVTIYGFVDLALRRVTNSDLGSVTSVASGGYRTSRLGFRGTEDLGGGLSAGFKLESAIAADTGGSGSTTVTQFFNRGSYVELGSTDYGTVRMGYDLNPAYVTWFENDPWFNIGMGSSGNLFDPSQNGPLRTVFGAIGKTETTAIYTRNMIQYFSPNIGGFFGVAGHAFREDGLTSTGAAGQTLIRLGYNKSGPFTAAMTYARSDAQVVTAGPVSKMTDWGATAAYDFGPVRLATTWREFKADTSKETHYLVAATAPVGVGRVQASYGRVKMSGSVSTNLAAGTKAGAIDANGASMVALGYQYFLSKRTQLYTTAVRISNHGGSFLALPSGKPVTPATFAGHTSTGFEVGISHAF